MPLPIAPASLQSETLLHFTGVNLRRDRLSLADEDCARAINADFHTKPGLAVTRGAQVYANATAYGAPIQGLARHLNTRIITTATAVYAEDVVLTSGLDPAGTMVESSRGLNDPETWLYIANRSGMQKYAVGASPVVPLRQWGIAAPTTAPTVADGGAGTLSGTYQVTYTYARKVGAAVAAESNPSPFSAAITLAASRSVLVTGLVASPDPQVTHLRVYRTLNGGGLFFFDVELPQGTSTTTTGTPDSGLGTQASFLNDPPPLATWCTNFQGSMFLLGNPENPHLLYYSETGFPESFPPFNYLAIEQGTDPLLAMTRMVGFLGVFTARTKYRITGNTVNGFIYTEAPTARGLVGPHAFCQAEGGVGFLARDGFYLTSFLGPDEPLHMLIESLWSGETIHDYAPIAFDSGHPLDVTYWNQRYYLTYTATDGATMVAVFSRTTSKWYFFQYGDPLSSLFSDTSTGMLLAGSTTGRLHHLEVPTVPESVPGLGMSLEPATRFLGDRSTRKTFTHLRADVTGPVVLEILIDDEVRYRMALDGTRQRRFQRLPDQLDGYTWRVRCRASSPATIASVTMYAKPYQAGN